MIYSRPAASFEATASGFPTGLTGTIGVRITDGIGGTTVARSTAGISEYPAGSGIYTKVLTAPGTEGQYQVVWDTGGASPQWATDEITVTGSTPEPFPSDLLCDVEDVASLLRARTKDDSGNELGDFTADTRPTDTEVEVLIEQAAEMVLAVANGDVPTRLYSFGRHVVALRTAMMVELTYWPEQVQRENSPYQHIRGMFEDALEVWNKSLDDSGGVRGRGPVCVKVASTIEAVTDED